MSAYTSPRVNFAILVLTTLLCKGYLYLYLHYLTVDYLGIFNIAEYFALLMGLPFAVMSIMMFMTPIMGVIADLKSIKLILCGCVLSCTAALILISYSSSLSVLIISSIFISINNVPVLPTLVAALKTKPFKGLVLAFLASELPFTMLYVPISYDFISYAKLHVYIFDLFIILSVLFTIGIYWRFRPMITYVYKISHFKIRLIITILRIYAERKKIIQFLAVYFSVIFLISISESIIVHNNYYPDPHAGLANHTFFNIIALKIILSIIFYQVLKRNYQRILGYALGIVFVLLLFAVSTHYHHLIPGFVSYQLYKSIDYLAYFSITLYLFLKILTTKLKINNSTIGIIFILFVLGWVYSHYISQQIMNIIFLFF